MQRKKQKSAFHFVIFQLIFLIFTFMAYANLTEISTQLDEYLSAHAKNKDFSGSVIVANQDKVIFSNSYGLSDYENDVSNTINTKFRLGSLSKPFTSLAIMILQERGRLNIEDPISQYIPDYPRGKQIKIRHLLTHTSGIPNYTAFYDHKFFMKHRRSPHEIIETFKDKDLLFDPGSRFEYSNSGYVLLGYIIERVAGKSYAEYIRESIFDPLNMQDSDYDRSFALVKGRARGYIQAGTDFENADFVDMSVPYSAGGLYSSVMDLMKFSRAILQKRIVLDKTWKQIFTSYYPTGYSHYGLGWFIDKIYDKKRISHPGAIQGFSAHLAIFPEDNFIIALLCNIEFAPLEQISRGIIGILLKKNIRIPPLKKTEKIAIEDFESYTGLYQVSDELSIEVFSEGKRLYVEPSGQPRFQILHRGKENYGPRMGNWYITFIRDEAGKVTGLILHVNGEKREGVKIYKSSFKEL